MDKKQDHEIRSGSISSNLTRRTVETDKIHKIDFDGDDDNDYWDEPEF